MRVFANYLLLIILLFFCCACREEQKITNIESTTISNESLVIYDPTTKRVNIEQFSREDFSNVVVGETMESTLNSIAPQHTGIQTAYGCIYEFPLDNGQYIRIICHAGIIQSIEYYDTPFQFDTAVQNGQTDE